MSSGVLSVMPTSMNDTFRKFQRYGCSLRGFQAMLRRNDSFNEYADNGSDCDWNSFCYQPCEYGCRNDGLHINCLPQEIIMKIFSFLSARTISKAVLPVCKKWYKLGNDPVLWKRLEFSYRSDMSYVNIVKTVSRRFYYMRSITLKGFRSSQQMEGILRHIGNNCSRLKQVQLYNCYLRADSLIRLGMTCPNIEALSLICCDENFRKNHYLWSYMKDASFVVSFPKLKSLTLFRTLATLSYDDAQNIVRVCKTLKRLVLDCDFYGRAIRLIIGSLSHCIEVLWLQGRNYNDSMCKEISKCCKLRELGLNHVENITPFGLKFIGTLPNLEKLLLFHANNISSTHFTDLFGSENLRNLSYVNLSGCKGADQEVECTIRKNCPKIRSIIFEVQSTRETAYVDFGIYQGFDKRFFKEQVE